MGEKVMKKGSQGADVKALQNDLGKLGYDVKVDGIYGDETEKAVLALQRAFGYTTDGIVGHGTEFLIRQQIGYNWNAKTSPAPQVQKPAAQSASVPQGAQAQPQPPAAPPATKAAQDPGAKTTK
jgi:peptidoglycan hydrolase-like protein with peptidoglycan-binding domain